MHMCIYVRCSYNIVYNELTKCFKCDFRALDYNINSPSNQVFKGKGSNVKKILNENVFLRTSPLSNFE